jgi:NADP-reducing hydrogenase subunit HndC
MPRLDRQALDAMKSAYQAPKNWIKVGLSTSGLASGAEPVYQALVEGVRERGLDVAVMKTGCVGVSTDEPQVEINVEGVPRTMYGQLQAEFVPWLLDAHVQSGRRVDKFVVPGFDELVRHEDDLPRPDDPPEKAAKQYRIVMRNCGRIDPENIADYIAVDGYQATARALLTMAPQQVIEQITASGLRGRGGAGFSTGVKWKLTQEAVGDEKFIICNGDEGDPGAYMDRSVLEDDPHAVIEGMIIGGYAIGAREGFFYIRAEYPLAIQRIEQAIRDARKLGLLGRNILGSGFDFNLEIRLGAGAFVCGEETALIASIEGKRGMPRPRPPFPSVSGLFGQPTCINNVETLANIPRIVLKGADWFSSVGTGKSKGTKVFAVTGKVARGGLVEIPMGTTLRTIIMDICGGSPTKHAIKAAQTGGPSGGVIPQRLFDTPVSYEHLMELGSIMGSGGLIVMDDTDSMVNIARFYLGFCVDESCGKCAPCRVGGKQMLQVLERLCDGRGRLNDVALLHKISDAMKGASLCGLGQTASNPVLSTLRYFPEEYQAALASQ